MSLIDRELSKSPHSSFSLKDSTIFIGTLFFLDLLHVMQNQGGITDIILQEMTWLIILMTVRGQLLSHVNERGLLILFFFFYRDVMRF